MYEVCGIDGNRYTHTLFQSPSTVQTTPAEARKEGVGKNRTRSFTTAPRSAASLGPYPASVVATRKARDCLAAPLVREEVVSARESVFHPRLFPHFLSALPLHAVPGGPDDGHTAIRKCVCVPIHARVIRYDAIPSV